MEFWRILWFLIMMWMMNFLHLQIITLRPFRCRVTELFFVCMYGMMIHFICLRPPVGWCVYVFSLLTAKELIVCIFTPICPQQIAHQKSCKIQWQIKLKIEECSESFVDEYWLKICWDWSPREVTNTSYHIGNSYARNMCSVCDRGFIAWREFLVSGWQCQKK